MMVRRIVLGAERVIRALRSLLARRGWFVRSHPHHNEIWGSLLAAFLAVGGLLIALSSNGFLQAVGGVCLVLAAYIGLSFFWPLPLPPLRMPLADSTDLERSLADPASYYAPPRRGRTVTDYHLLERALAPPTARSAARQQEVGGTPPAETPDLQAEEGDAYPPPPPAQHEVYRDKVILRLNVPGTLTRSVRCTVVDPRGARSTAAASPKPANAFAALLPIGPRVATLHYPVEFESAQGLPSGVYHVTWTVDDAISIFPHETDDVFRVSLD